MYQAYVTEQLRLIGENVAKQVGGAYLPVKFMDLINPPKIETKSCSEIVDDIVKRAGLVVIDSGAV